MTSTPSDTRPELLVAFLAALALIVTTVLICLGHPVPDAIASADLVLVGAVAGIAAPKGGGTAAAIAPAVVSTVLDDVPGLSGGATR